MSMRRTRIGRPTSPTSGPVGVGRIWRWSWICSRGDCWDNSPWERFFRSLISEWIPEIGYASFDEEKQRITQYVIGYYSLFRPHANNAGLTPNAAEQRYCSDYN